MKDEVPRSREARAAAELALVRVVHHYGARPEFVLLGGLVPELLCVGSEFQHAGTTDIDVQVNLEIACGSVNSARLERALRNAEFEPDDEHPWRWTAKGSSPRTVVKFELLADLDDVQSETTVTFDGCDQLGAMNLRGTGFATRDFNVKVIKSRLGGDELTAEINVTGLAGFILAKCAAARSRRKPKDWYDIAFVLSHNESGGPQAAAEAVLLHFGDELDGMRSSLNDLSANFADPDAQGSRAYEEQMMLDHPDLDEVTLRADAVVCVQKFLQSLDET